MGGVVRHHADLRVCPLFLGTLPGTFVGNQEVVAGRFQGGASTHYPSNKVVFLNTVAYQDAETGRQRRARFAQGLHVPQRVRVGPSRAAALLAGLCEHSASGSGVDEMPDVTTPC